MIGNKWFEWRRKEIFEIQKGSSNKNYREDTIKAVRQFGFSYHIELLLPLDNDNIIAWIEENNIDKYCKIHIPCDRSDLFFFRNELDATAFKLRWYV